MTLTEATATATAAGAALALSLSAITAVIDKAHQGAWLRAQDCVETVLASKALTPETVIDDYVAGTVGLDVKAAVDGCVTPLVTTPDPLLHLPADVADRLGIPTVNVSSGDGEK